MNTGILSMNPDAEKERLEQLLAQRLGSRIRDLRLIFQQTGVVVRGWCETFHAKQVAQHAIMEFSRTPILANEIEVKA